MQKDMIFFGQEGITDTKASQIADFAKLSYLNDESYIESLTFINEKVETINGDNQKELVCGVENLSGLDEIVERIGNLKSLCAWLREAVTAHQNLINDIQLYTLSKYAAENEIEVPTGPKREKAITEEDVIATFDIKKRNRYYWLETMASTIGKVIHKDCPFDRARKYYYNKLQKPHNAVGSGNDMIIYTYTPSIGKNEIENTFYKLQQMHVRYQSELNSIKSEIKSRITNDEIEKSRKFEEEFNIYTEEYGKLVNRFNTWKSEESKRIAALKIVIPNSLQEIFNSVASIGKKD